MLRPDRLSFTLLAAGLLMPAMAHAQTQPAAAPPATPPAVTSPAPAPTPAPETAATTPAPAAAAPAPAAPAPAPEAAASLDASTDAPTEPTESGTTEPTEAAASTTTETTSEVVDAAGTEDRPAPEIPEAEAEAEAEADPYEHVPFNIGLFPPLSINGAHRGQKVRNTISVALGWSRVDRLEGAAAAMGLTIVDEDAHGVTWGMLGNLTHGEHRGVQATSGFNHAHQLRGAQLGLLNHTHEARGAQFGLLNLSRGRLRGVQFGLVNYAEEADASFALIPVTKKGGVRAEVWSSDTAAITAGIRLPANYTYAFFAGGVHPIARASSSEATEQDRSRRGTALMAGMGFGGHLPVNDEVALEADASAWIVSEGLRGAPPVASLAKVRAMVAWQLRPRIAVWGGPTLNVMVDEVDREVSRPGYGWITGSHQTEDVRIRWWPGFAAGLRF
ncbi:MAG: hypothetical protein AAGF11_14145 [Myxococcota bacterium]